jgi:hypothetical protein
MECVRRVAVAVHGLMVVTWSRRRLKSQRRGMVAALLRQPAAAALTDLAPPTTTTTVEGMTAGLQTGREPSTVDMRLWVVVREMAPTMMHQASVVRMKPALMQRG